MNTKSSQKIQSINEFDILNELATLNPLDDRAFKILASDDEQFALMTKFFSGEDLTGEKIIHMNGKIMLTANGRLIRADSLRSTVAAVFNIESQMEVNKFPLKRHIFYTDNDCSKCSKVEGRTNVRNACLPCYPL